MSVDVARFKATFFEEAAEHLATMESGLLELEGTARPEELLNRIFRAAHSIKGSGGMFGFDAVSRFTHQVETVLDLMRHGELVPTRPTIDVLLRATDVMAVLIAAARAETEGAPVSVPATDELEAALRACIPVVDEKGLDAPRCAAASEAAHEPAARLRIRYEPGPDTLRQGLDPVLLLRDLGQIAEVLEVAVDTSQLPPFESLDAETSYLSWTAIVPGDTDRDAVADVFLFVSDGEVSIVDEGVTPSAPERVGGAGTVQGPNGTPPASRAVTAPRDNSTLRVPAAKVDKLIDLVGEVVIAQSIILEAVREFRIENLALLQEAALEMERYTHELQERVMGIRMVPVGTVFNRFPRVVRDLASACGKEITLAISGEDIELDKSVAEGLSDPLTHLVRNAVDHGLEDAAARVTAGKDPAGTIRLAAAHRGGSVVISVSDDGRGLDIERIRRRAVERGLLRPDEAADEARIQSLIFEPGFSTAEAVTDISGRGVGMDVVRRNIDALNGSVAIRSVPGAGTAFEIRLPLTLAILDGLIVGVGRESYVLPLASIVESLRPDRSMLKAVQGRGEVVLVRDNPLPLMRLHRLFGIEDAVTDPGRGLIVVAENDGEHVAILVDDLLGQSQVVIKSLESNYKRVEGVMGATIMGDGRVALILDVTGLVRLGYGSRRHEVCP